MYMFYSDSKQNYCFLSNGWKSKVLKKVLDGNLQWHRQDVAAAYYKATIRSTRVASWHIQLTLKENLKINPTFLLLSSWPTLVIHFFLLLRDINIKLMERWETAKLTFFRGSPLSTVIKYLPTSVTHQAKQLYKQCPKPAEKSCV